MTIIRYVLVTHQEMVKNNKKIKKENSKIYNNEQFSLSLSLRGRPVPSPSTKGRIQSSPPLPSRLRLVPLPPRPLLAPPCCSSSSSSLVTTTLGTTGACHSALLFIGICALLVWIWTDSLHKQTAKCLLSPLRYDKVSDVVQFWV